MRPRRSCGPAPATRCNGEVFNVGGDEPSATATWSRCSSRSPARGAYRFVEWPPEKKAIDIGSFYADSSRFRRAPAGAPRVPLREGLARTFAYYREHLADYAGE
jgi:UDP-glucose 4-epimerase